jgi:membrane protease YdiL (CAAX protease family)
MKIDTNGLLDVSLSHRRNLAFGLGVVFLISAIMDLIYVRSWVTEIRLHWLGNFLVEIFGSYGPIGFEFVLAVACICQGLAYTLKLNNGEKS